jgi:prepilin-type N-terminal cleavage/methylation domain-containing protein
LELPNFRTPKLPRSGLTLFELLAVLTVISIGLMILVGSYGSWGTAHALTGATRILEAGLQQARSTAMSQNAYVGFEYGSVSTNSIQTVTGFQFFLFTNDNAEVAAELQDWVDPSAALDLPFTIPASPFQRLSGHVVLGNIQEKDIKIVPPSISAGVILVFRPDGSVWSWEDKQAHYLCVQTRERFAKGQPTAQSLMRILRVDLTTGFITVIGEP